MPRSSKRVRRLTLLSVGVYAEKEAHKANLKTEKALNREIEGQEKLITAGMCSSVVAARL